jgi:hypothetical protein
MRLSRTLAHAGLPYLYRCPLICSGEALEALARTLNEQPKLGHLIRSIIVIPFTTTYGQMTRAQMPQTRGRGASRTAHGSYSHLIQIMNSASTLDHLGLRFTSISTIRPLSAYLSSRNILSLQLCGTCLGQPYRLRLKLALLITVDLDLPLLETLSLEDFTIGPEQCVQWPNLPSLRTFKLLRTWHSNTESPVIPPNCPNLVDVQLGTSPLTASVVLATSLDRYQQQLERLHLVGSRTWHSDGIQLTNFTALKELVLEATPCGYGPPALDAISPMLQTIRIKRIGSTGDLPLWALRTGRMINLAQDSKLVGVTLDGSRFPAAGTDDLLKIMLSAACITQSIVLRDEVRGMVPLS